MNRVLLPTLILLILISHQLIGDELTDVDREKLNGRVKSVQTVEYQTSTNIDFIDLDDERIASIVFGNPHNMSIVRFNVNGSYQEIVDECPSMNSFSRVLWKYSPSGQKEEIEYYNKDNQLKGKMLFKYERANHMVILLQDDKGNAIEEWTHVFNCNGDTIRIIGYKYGTKERVHTLSTYNLRRQLVARKTKINGKTTLRENYKSDGAGILIWEKSFSEDGTREVYYDSNGERLQEIETYTP